MFRKRDKMYISKRELSNYILGFDVYNSALIDYIRDPSVEKIYKVITEHEYRPDLIAKDIYGEDGYEGILYLTCGTSLENYYKGAIIEVISPNSLHRILQIL